VEALSRIIIRGRPTHPQEARDDGVLGRQWHQLDHMQTICSSLQTDNHTNTSSLNFYRPDALAVSMQYRQCSKPKCTTKVIDETASSISVANHRPSPLTICHPGVAASFLTGHKSPAAPVLTVTYTTTPVVTYL